MTPAVTVLMAVHDGAAYVDAAIRSILRQTHTDFEFLIIDDGSSDDTCARIESYDDARIRLVRNDANIGLTRSLNRGLSLARAPLVARQDADDISHADRLAAQLKALEEAPRIAVIGTQARTIDARGRVVRAAPWPKSTAHLAICWQLMFDSPFVHTSVMFRRAVVWSELDGYDDRFATGQDYELWTRVAAAGHELRNLSRVLVDFRIHCASVSMRYDTPGVSRLRQVLEDSFRAQAGAESLPAGWPDAWIRLNNPRVYPNQDDAPEAVASAIEYIHGCFVRRHPVAAYDDEIRRHRAAMLLRVATAGAASGSIRSLLPFARACRMAPAMAAFSVPRYAAHLTRGWRRRPDLSP